MLRTDFHFELPEALIAQTPLPERSASRLLRVPCGNAPLEDRVFSEVPELLRAGDLLIFNDTRVVPARLLGRKASGGKVEVMLERVLDEHRVLVQMRASKAAKPGTRLRLEEQFDAEVLARHGDLFELRFETRNSALEVLQAHARIPLPPYINREADAQDSERYQTCYARVPGAVAAPTAGLHFTPKLLEQLQARGVEHGFVTLHVGAGTFQPVRVERVEDHHLHAERIEVSADLVARIKATRAHGGRVIAVGTTSVRSLEAAAQASNQASNQTAGAVPHTAFASPAFADIQPFDGESDIFIYPGYRFRVVDALITNFHLPESSLLMLVSAFSGRERVLAAYRHAVEQRYRFFSYGDAMFLQRCES